MQAGAACSTSPSHNAIQHPLPARAVGGIVVYFLLQYAKEKNELRKELNAVDDAQKSGSTGALY